MATQGQGTVLESDPESSAKIIHPVNTVRAKAAGVDILCEAANFLASNNEQEYHKDQKNLSVNSNSDHGKGEEFKSTSYTQKEPITNHNSGITATSSNSNSVKIAEADKLKSETFTSIEHPVIKRCSVVLDRDDIAVSSDKSDSEIKANSDRHLLPCKKRKVDGAEVLTENTNIHEVLSDLSAFKLEKILLNNPTRKTVCLQGSFSDSNKEKAIVFLEKTAFAEEDFGNNSDHFSAKSSLLKQFHNDIYGNYKYYPTTELNSVKATVIYPASEKHIEKYSPQNSHIVDETPELYNDIVLPYICQNQFNLKWVYNILEHKSEADRIVFEDPDPEIGFTLLPDLKWDGSTETLYLLAIVQKHDIKSVRHLTGEHLPLLRNIRDKGIKVIQEKYGITGNVLRIYLHHHPSFYHLHVHFTYLRYEAPGISAERAHLLSNVISNLEICPDYYQKVTLPIVIFGNSELFKRFEEHNILKK